MTAARAPFATNAAAEGARKPLAKAPTGAARASVFATAKGKVQVKAPFATATGATRIEGKAREAVGGKAPLSFKGFSINKSSQQSTQDDKKKAVPKLALLSAPGAAFKLKSTPGNDPMRAPSLAKPEAPSLPKPPLPKQFKNSTPRFQIKVGRALGDPIKLVSAVSVSAKSQPSKSVPPENKKRYHPREFSPAPADPKKSRLEKAKLTKLSPKKSPSVCLPHIVSPEPKLKTGAQLVTCGNKDLEPRVLKQDISGERHLCEESGCRAPVLAKSNTTRAPDIRGRHTLSLQLNGPGSSNGVFVSPDEEAMASYDPCDESFEVENETFLKRVREIQIFVDDAAVKRHNIESSLLDSHACATECLLEIINDLTALKGGITLRQLDEIAITAQQDFDAKILFEVVFP